MNSPAILRQFLLEPSKRNTHNEKNEILGKGPSRSLTDTHWEHYDDVTLEESFERLRAWLQFVNVESINKKQDIIETKNNTTNIQYQVVQFKGS